MIVRRLTSTAVLAVAMINVPTTQGNAAAPTCDGQDATILGTDAGETLTGTEGPDVVWPPDPRGSEDLVSTRRGLYPSAASSSTSTRASPGSETTCRSVGRRSASSR